MSIIDEEQRSHLPTIAPAGSRAVNTFEAEASDAVGQVRIALSQLVAAVPGEMRRPTDLQRTLRVDSKLCWQVFNVIRSTDTLAAGAYVPGALSLKRFLKATARLKVRHDLIENVNRAIDQFNRVVETHAPDRAAFDSMVSAVSDSPSNIAANLVHRRNAYRSNCHLWGVQVDTFSRLTLVRRSASGRGIDECFANVKAGLRRMQPGASLFVHGYRRQPVAGSSAGPADNYYTPLEPTSADEFGVPLLPEFCTQPLPRLVRYETSDGWVRSELDSKEVGLRSAVDLAFSSVGHEVPFARTVDGRKLCISSTLISLPTMLLISDLAIHRPSFGEVLPELINYGGSRGDETPDEANLAHQMPINAAVVCLGSGVEIKRTKDIANYPDMVQRVCSRLQWNPAEFDFYRVRIPYPVLNSVVRLQFECPSTKK